MKSIKTNFIYNIAYNALNMLLPLVTAPYLARVIGLEGIGLFSYTYSVVSYFMMACILGLNNYGNREIAKVRDDQEKRSKVFCSIYAMQLVISIAVILVYWLSVWRFFGIEYRLIWIISGIYIISSALDINWFYFGLEEFKLTVTRNFLIRLFTFALMFVVVRCENDLWKYILLLAASALCSQIVLWIFIRKFIIFYKPSVKDITKHIKPNFILFLPVLAISLYEVMDKIMIGYISDIRQTGLYESANKVIKMPQMIFASLGTVMLPRISALVGKNSDSAFVYVRDSMQFVMILACGMVFGVLAISKRFVPIFYGNGFDECVILLMAMAPVLVLSPWKSVIRTQCLIPLGKDRSYVISVFLGAAVNLIINFLLIPHCGALGAVIATVATELIVCIYQTCAVVGLLPIRTYFIDNWGFLLCGLLMYLTLCLGLEPFLPENILGLVVLIACSIILYLLFITVIYALINKERFHHIRLLLHI